MYTVYGGPAIRLLLSSSRSVPFSPEDPDVVKLVHPASEDPLRKTFAHIPCGLILARAARALSRITSDVFLFLFWYSEALYVEYINDIVADNKNRDV